MVGIELIVGAFSGGIVSYLFGAGLTFLINAASFLGAAIIISSITFPEKNAIQDEKPQQKEKLIPYWHLLAIHYWVFRCFYWGPL